MLARPSYYIDVPQARTVRLSLESLEMNVVGAFSNGFSICHLAIFIGPEGVSFTHADLTNTNEEIDQEITWLGEDCQKLLIYRQDAELEEGVRELKDQDIPSKDKIFIHHAKSRAGWTKKVVGSDVHDVSVKIKKNASGELEAEVCYEPKDILPQFLLKHPQQFQFHTAHKVEEDLCYDSTELFPKQTVIFDGSHWVDISAEEFEPRHSKTSLLKERLKLFEEAARDVFSIKDVLVCLRRLQRKGIGLTRDELAKMLASAPEIQDYFCCGQSPESIFLEDFKALLGRATPQTAADKNLATELVKAKTPEAANGLFKKEKHFLSGDYRDNIQGFLGLFTESYQYRKSYQTSAETYCRAQQRASDKQSMIAAFVQQGQYGKALDQYQSSVLDLRLGYTTAFSGIRNTYRSMVVCSIKLKKMAEAAEYMSKASALTSLHGTDEEQKTFNEAILQGCMAIVPPPLVPKKQTEEKATTEVLPPQDPAGARFRQCCANSPGAQTSAEEFENLVRRALDQDIFWSQSVNGNTGLHWALLHGQYAKAKTMLQLEAEYQKAHPGCKEIRHIKNHDKKLPQTPLDIAKQKNGKLPAELADLLGLPAVKPQTDQAKTFEPN